MTIVLVQSLNKMHMKYILHKNFGMIISHDQKSLSLNFKSSHSRILLKFGNVHRKTPVLELLFNIVAWLEDCNCITKRFQRKYFLVNIVKFLRTSILKNICERLHISEHLFKNLISSRSTLL